MPPADPSSLSADPEANWVIWIFQPVTIASLCLLWLLHRGLIPGFQFRPAQDRREPALWSLAEVLATLGFFIVVGVLCEAWLQFFYKSGSLSEAGYHVLVTLISTSAVCFMVWTLVRVRLMQPLATLGLAACPMQNVPAVLALYLLTFFPLQSLGHAWQFLLEQMTGKELERQSVVDLFQEQVASGSQLSVALLVILGVVLAPFAEELVFRGLILGWLQARWGAWCGAIVSAALFAAAHRSLSALLPLFVLGLILAYTALRTRSLYCSMLFHAVFNGVSFALLVAKT